MKETNQYKSTSLGQVNKVEEKQDFKKSRIQIIVIEYLYASHKTKRNEGHLSNTYFDRVIRSHPRIINYLVEHADLCTTQ